MTLDPRAATVVMFLSIASVIGMMVNCDVPGLEEASHFPLEGTHAVLGCASCHVDSLETPLPTDCAGCHADDRPEPHYDGTCEECHTPVSWADVDVTHDFFPLELGHGGLECLACHDAGDFSTLDPSCASCHEQDRPLDHFGGSCETCHTISGWLDATYPHDEYLSLEGGHEPLVCSNCHEPDTYAGLDNACESCHEADRPGGHYPGGCAECHDVYDWNDSDFDHAAFFPTPHQGVSACEDCHLGGDTTTFSCTDCHAHGESAMTSIHAGIGGFEYSSSSCLGCHPAGTP